MISGKQLILILDRLWPLEIGRVSTSSVCRLFFVVTFIITNVASFAQSALERTGSYTMQLMPTMTMVDCERECVEQARLAVIAKEFGVLVSETTIQNTSDKNGQVNAQFSVLTRTAVKGEWLSDVRSPVTEWFCENNLLFVKATVSGQIRALAEQGKTVVEFYTCAPGDHAAKKFQFRDGESLNARFKASKDGYLSVFYIDHAAGTVSRLLPAATGQNQDHVKVSADKEYILFNRVLAATYDWGKVSTEVQLYLPESLELASDELVIVYSTEAYQKPMLNMLAHTTSLAELTIEEFETWATDLTLRQQGAIVKRVNIALVP